MEAIKSRFNLLSDALDCLSDDFEAINRPGASLFHIQIRNSTIQSFEFTADLFWKCLKDLLEEQYGIREASPKKVFREAFSQKIIAAHEFKLLEAMINDRNDTSHKYDEKMAEEIAGRAPEYYKLMHTVAERIRKELQQS